MAYNKNMPSEHYDAADKAALDNSAIPSGLVSEDLHFDSAENASVFFARELDYIKAQTYDVQYPEFTAETLFPVSHEVNAGALTVTYYSYEKTGLAKIIENYSTDLPRADVKGKPTTSQIRSIGDSYGYSMQDMRASRMAGKSLDTRRGEAAKYQIDRKAESIAWMGDTDAGLVGVISTNNDVPVYSLSVGSESETTAWADKEPAEILADILGMLKFMQETTMNVEKPDTLLLPESVYTTLMFTLIDGTAVSVLEFLEKNLKLKGISIKCTVALEAASTETNPYGVNVVLLYRNDPNKLTIEIPLKFFQYAAQPKGLEIEVPCEERHAGAIIYYPMSLLIAAGV